MNVSVLVVRAYLEMLGERGVSREQFLSAAGLDPGRLDELDGRLDLAELDRVQAAALELTGDPALGLHMGERVQAPAYDVIGYLASHAPTLRESLESLFRYGRIVSDMTATLEEDGDLATLVCAFRGSPESPLVRLTAESAVTGFMRLLQTFCGEAAMPREVLFQHAAPAYRAEYTRIFKGLERFEQPVTGLRFERAMLSREAVHKNARLSALLTSEAERMLERLERQVTYADRLRELLATQGVSEAPTMEEVARRLGTSARSLRRRLAEEGVSYPRLLEEAHAGFAKRLLEDSDRSIHEVSFEMGFSDPSAFHRAFRRWTGMTPQQYREKSR